MVTKAKFKKGQWVRIRKGVGKIESVSYITHPELLIGANIRTPEGFFYMISVKGPMGMEEPRGWMHEKYILRKAKKKELKSVI